MLQMTKKLTLPSVLLPLVCCGPGAGTKVVGHSWTRQVEVLQYKISTGIDWCDQVPAGAQILSQENQIRSHEKISDGQTCKPGRKRCLDIAARCIPSPECQGGEKSNQECQEQCTPGYQECVMGDPICTPKYKDVPVWSPKCTFTLSRWNHSRWETASGRDQLPWWPQLHPLCSLEQEGCEKEGERKAIYKAELRDKNGTTFSYNLEEEEWKTLQVGSKWMRNIADRIP